MDTVIERPCAPGSSSTGATAQIWIHARIRGNCCRQKSSHCNHLHLDTVRAQWANNWGLADTSTGIADPQIEDLSYTLHIARGLRSASCWRSGTGKGCGRAGRAAISI